MEKLENILSRYKGRRENTIPILQEIQKEYGYLPEKALKELSEFIGITETQIYGIATFYAQFKFKARGKKHIMVCTGTACHVKGADQVLDAIKRHLHIEEGDTTPDLEYSLESVGCIGCCSLAPCAIINDKVISKLRPIGIKRVLAR